MFASAIQESYIVEYG